MADSLTAAELVVIAKGLRKTLDPWKLDNTPVGPSTRVRQQWVRCLSLTGFATVGLCYLKGIPSRGEPNGWELRGLRNREGDPFLAGKHTVGEAHTWANELLLQDGWIFEEK